MFDAARRALRRLRKREPASLTVTWVRANPGAWLSTWGVRGVIAPDRLPIFDMIELLADNTNVRGPQPLWVGYKDDPRGPMRNPDAVRTRRTMGSAFAALTAARKPEVVVEFGTAFGVSGMYWLAGMEVAGSGTLYTFEPNEIWAKIAEENLRAISGRYRLTIGTFEQEVDRVLGSANPIDLAFIDAIHTSEFVTPQLEIVIARSRPGALIVLDDINFSDDMRACWARVAQDKRFIATATLGERVGIVELGP